MGKVTALKQQELLEKNLRVASVLAKKRDEFRAEKAHSLSKLDVVSSDVLAYSDYFLHKKQDYVSKLKSKDLVRKKMEQVRFFFNKFPVCKALENAWVTNTPGIKTIDFKKWYILVAQGKSLYKEGAKEFLTKRDVHCFVTCPYDYSPLTALVYAIAKSTGAPEGVSTMLATTKLKERSLTDAFWVSVVRFFAKNTPSSRAVVNDLIDYLMHKKAENMNFEMAGQHLSTMLVKMEEWHRALQRSKVLGNASWTGHAYPDLSYRKSQPDKTCQVWTFTQIKDTKKLAAEGTAMRHCVLSYKSRCLDGSTSIWSLTMDRQTEDGVSLGTPDRKLTIEVKTDLGVVQARGLANRAPRPEEKAILVTWARDLNICLPRYVY